MTQPIAPAVESSVEPQPKLAAPYAPPAGASEFAMWLGVILIGIMFAAGCIAYAMVRQHTQLKVDVPLVFWASTLVINVSSVFLYYAMLSDKVAHRTAARRAIDVTALLSLAFLLLQIPGLQQVIAAHGSAIAQGHGIYAVMLVLVSLHGAHVSIGLIALAFLARRVHREKQISHQPSIRLISIYWHGLTIIWLALFSLMQFAK